MKQKGNKKMNMQEYKFLLFEREELAKLLFTIPLDNIIDRIGLEDRKKEIDEIISSQPKIIESNPVARLTFKGKPVIESYGIYADFSAKAIKAFSESIATIAANQNNTIGARGIIPGRDKYHLIIKDIALGSFGFELEAAPNDDCLIQDFSSIENAIDKIQTIFRASIRSDDELTEAIYDIDSRAIESVTSFLKVLSDQDAVCSLSFKESVFKYENNEQIIRSMERLSTDNICQKEVSFKGEFQGYLPSRKTFEFQITEKEEIIFGKVSSDFEGANEINNNLNVLVEIDLMSHQVGEGKPRYTLLNFNKVKK